MCDSIMKVSEPVNVHKVDFDEPFSEEFPKFRDTKLRQLDDVLKERDTNGLYKLDTRIEHIMKRNEREEFKDQLKNEEDKEFKQALLHSMSTITEEREKDQCVVNFFNKIGKFKELPDFVCAIYDTENPLKNVEQDKPTMNKQRYEQLVEKAISEYLVNNISEEEIASIRAMLFPELSDVDTQPDSAS